MTQKKKKKKKKPTTTPTGTTRLQPHYITPQTPITVKRKSKSGSHIIPPHQSKPVPNEEKGKERGRNPIGLQLKQCQGIRHSRSH
jgi:hypothetical protein